MNYRISVISISFNNLEELLVTCKSVDEQTIKPFEHWIIDGSSNQDIRNFLASHPQPGYRKWLSEPDKGIADAFNKGVQRATGDIINMLNSADSYFDTTVLADVTKAFENNPAISWLHGKFKLQRGNIWVEIGKRFEKSKLYRGMRSLNHQSMFVKKQLHEKYGLYDSSLRNAMDYDFVCRIAGEPMLFINKPLIIFAPGGVTQQHYLRGLAESRQVYEKYYGHSMKLSLWQVRLKTLFYLLNSPLGKLLYRIKVLLKLENM